MYTSFEKFKVKKHFLCASMVEAERLRKTLRDIGKLIYTSCIFTINATSNTLKKRFHRDEKNEYSC